MCRGYGYTVSNAPPTPPPMVYQESILNGVPYTDWWGVIYNDNDNNFLVKLCHSILEH